MSGSDSLSLGFGGISRFSGQRMRTSDGLNRGGVRYPSPFFDIAHTYLPPSMKNMMRWCRYYYLVNPLINATIHKMAEYPITEIIIDEKNPDIKEKWEQLLGMHLRYRPFQIETGLDYFTYGICVTTIHFPFEKYLICSNCKFKKKAADTYYRWRNLDYIVECEKCGEVGPARVQDVHVKDVRRIRLLRWNPEYLNIDQSYAGTDPIYTFELPIGLRNDILMGKKNLLDTIPDVFIEAMKRNKYISFAPENVFVLKRSMISQKEYGWGMPLIMPVMKDTFYMQTLRKAQEAIAAEHIVPLRILFPQAGSSTSDPYVSVGLDVWKSRIESEISKWKLDPNYIPILPLPIGNETIGGDGKAMSLYQEIELWSRHILAGMQVPEEFIFGGMQYSGSNVSMRMLENSFLGYRIDHELMMNQFVIKRISNYMGWPVVQAHMKRFKMADDLQRNAFLLNLNQMQKLSDQTLLQECDQDPVVESDRKKLEVDRQIEDQRKSQLAMAAIQGEAMLIQSKFQAQAAMQMPGQLGGQQDPNAQGGQEGEMVPGDQAMAGMPPGSSVSPEEGQQTPGEGIPNEMQSPLTAGQKGGGFNLLYMAKRAANSLGEMDEVSKNQYLNSMRMQNPQLYMLTIQLMQSKQGSQASPLSPIQSPTPTQKPSRRPAPTG